MDTKRRIKSMLFEKSIEKDNFNIAVKEWFFVCRFHTDERDIKCMCKMPVKHIYLLYNPNNKNIISLGKSCFDLVIRDKEKDIKQNTYSLSTKSTGSNVSFDIEEYLTNNKYFICSKCIKFIQHQTNNANDMCSACYDIEKNTVKCIDCKNDYYKKNLYQIRCYECYIQLDNKTNPSKYKICIVCKKLYKSYKDFDNCYECRPTYSRANFQKYNSAIIK